MPTNGDFRKRLHVLLNERISLDDILVLCLYLRIDHENLDGQVKRVKLASLISEMDRRNGMSLLCHEIITIRPDLEKDILRLGYAINGALPYLDIANNSLLPPPGIAHILRNPEEMYVSLNCSGAVEDQVGEDALKYIDRVLIEKHVVLIVGDYGTGKSFLAQKAFLRQAKDYRARPEPGVRVPILLPLRELVGRGDDLVVNKIVEHLRMLRFFSGVERDHSEDRVEIEERLKAGDFLCILDGFDEIPLLAMRLNPLDDLNSIVSALAIGHNRVIITSRPAILPGVLRPGFASDTAALGVGYLLPWRDEEIWRKYLLACEDAGVDFGGKLDRFELWVRSKPELVQLTRTPLYCQMLVETRRDIINSPEMNLAGLYQTYAERYFENVSERSPLRLRLPNLLDEIRYKKDCLAATAVGMLNKNNLRLTIKEIETALNSEAQDYDDELLEAFTKLDALIYSLLVPDAGEKFSFSHKSFYEFFVALKIYHELTGKKDDRFGVLGRQPLPNEIITFFAGLLGSNSGFRESLARAFEKKNPLEELGMSGRNNVLLRNLALTQLELNHRLEGVSLEGLCFNGYRFSSNQEPRELIRANLNQSKMEGANLTHVVLRDSQMRSTKLNKCVLDGADLRRVDLTGASLLDISCQDARFSGATFELAVFKRKDAVNIRAAIDAEKKKYPAEMTDDWYRDAQKLLSRESA